MKFLKAIFMFLFRTVEVIVGLLVLMFVLTLLLDIPGCNRLHRYTSYKSLQEITAAETNDVLKIVPFQQDGSNFTAVVVAPCRFLASGPAALIYDQDGNLIDYNRDVGGFGYKSRRRNKDWNFSPWGPKENTPLRDNRIF